MNQFGRFIKYILFFSLLLSQAFAGKKLLTIVTPEYPPYEYSEGGTVKGVAVEIVKEVFKRMDVPITINILPWKRALDQVRSGKTDAIFTIFFNKERATFLTYSNEVLIEQVVSLFANKEFHSKVNYKSQLELLGPYRIGGVRGISYGREFDSALKNKGIQPLKLVNNGSQSFKMLLSNRVDLVISNRLGAIFILRKMNSVSRVVELAPHIDSVPSFLAFSKKSKFKVLQMKFDIHLKEIKKDGTYTGIVSKYGQKEVDGE